MLDDKTTQAKIRDAAIARFPVDGLRGTTVRAIAKDAGVSPGLVIHHFGSKEGLHRACDDHVVQLLIDLKAESIREGTYRQAEATAAAYRMSEGPLRYLAWTMTTGSETASRIFDDYIEEATELMLESKGSLIGGEIYGEPRKQAAVLIAMQMSFLIFHDHLTRAFEVDTLSAEGLIALAPYALQIYSGDLFDQGIIAQTKEALSQLNEAQEATA